MKKILVPLSALAMLALVACGGTSSSSSPAPSSEPAQSSSQQQSSSQEQVVAQISNKEALGAEWHVGEADRAVELNLTPKCNITQAIADGTITIVSDNEEAVTVLGRQLHAMGEGDAKVTVTYKGVSDSVDLHVDAAIVEPDYAAPKTLSEIMALEGDDVVTPEADANHTYSKLAYPSRVKVAVIGSKVDGSNPADKYGNLYVTDPSSNEAEPAKIQVYGSGASMGALSYVFDEGYYKYVNAQNYLENEDTKAIKVGDELDVIIIRADYKTTKEISMVIRAINDKPIANDVRTTDQVNATEDSKNVRAQLVSVSGKITSWDTNKEDGTKYGNFFIQTEGSKTDPVYVYGATASSTKTVTSDEGETILDVLAMQDDGSWKFNNPQDWLTNAATKDLVIGDMITLTGFRCDYQGTLELTGIVSKYIEPAERPNPTAATIADLIAKTEAENDKTYTLSGIWEPNNPGKYGNGYLTDAATGKTIQVYGLSANPEAIEFDGSSGEPVFKYTNKQDFDTNDKTKDLKGGELITVEAMNAYYKAKNTPEISAVLTASAASEAKYTATVAEVEGGTAELSKTAELAYGEEVTVTVTPASGYKVAKVEVENSWGKKTEITETLKFKAGCVNKVIPTFVAEAADPTAEMKSVVTTTTDAKALTEAGTLTESLGLDKDIFTVTYDKNGAGNDAAIRNDGTVRMYATKQTTNGNKFTVTAATGYAIKSIAIEYDGDAPSTTQVLVGGELVAGTEGVYTINNEAFTLFNNNSEVSSNTQLRFKKITITYAVANAD